MGLVLLNMIVRVLVRSGGGCQEEDGPGGGLARLHHRSPAGHRGRQEVEGSARQREIQGQVLHPPRGEGGSEGAFSDDLNNLSVSPSIC